MFGNVDNRDRKRSKIQTKNETKSVESHAGASIQYRHTTFTGNDISMTTTVIRHPKHNNWALVRFFITVTVNLKLDYHIKCIVTEKICKLVKWFKQTKCRWPVWTAVVSGQWCWTKWKAKLCRFWLLICCSRTGFSKDGTGTEWGCTCSKESCVPSAFRSHWCPKQVWVLCAHLKFTCWACWENSLMKMMWVWNSSEIRMFERQTETISSDVIIVQWWLLLN